MSLKIYENCETLREHVLIEDPRDVKMYVDEQKATTLDNAAPQA